MKKHKPTLIVDEGESFVRVTAKNGVLSHTVLAHRQLTEDWLYSFEADNHQIDDVEMVLLALKKTQELVEKK